MPAGRPTKYDPKYCNMLIDHMEEGLSFEAFAGVISVNQDTLHEWAKVQPKFSEAKAIAFSRCRLFWEKKGIEGLFSDKDGMKINASLWTINMKNRFGWRERQDIVTRDETLKDPIDMTDEELMERVPHALKVCEEYESELARGSTTKGTKKKATKKIKSKASKK